MRRILSFIIVFLMIPLCIYAEDYKVISENKIEITDKAEPDTLLSIMVLKPGKTLEDVNSAEKLTDVFVAYKECETDSEGNFSFGFEVDGTAAKSGIYTVIIGDNLEAPQRKSLYFINKERNEEAALLFAVESNKPDFILQRLYDLGLEDNLVNKSTAEGTVKIFEASVADITKETADSISKKQQGGSHR